MVLRRYRDFKQRYNDKHEPQYVEKISEIGWLSWMSARDSTVRCIDGGAHEFCVEWVVHPLTDTHKHDPGENEKCMDIGDAFDFYSQSGNYPRCTKCNKELVPVLNLKPGMQFVPHMANVQIEGRALARPTRM